MGYGVGCGSSMAWWEASCDGNASGGFAGDYVVSLLVCGVGVVRWETCMGRKATRNACGRDLLQAAMVLAVMCIVYECNALLLFGTHTGW